MNAERIEVGLMAAHALKSWLDAGMPVDELRVAVDKRLANGDESAKRLADAIRAHDLKAADQ